jgi:DNA-binding NtrC family response regulator
LRERPEDIRALSEHFVRKHSGVGSGPATLTRLAHERLLRHDWPGNVRELENVIVRALNACESTLIDLDNLGLDPDIPAPQTDAETAPLAGFKQMKKRAVDNFEKHYLERLMSDYHGNVSQAAKFAGKERRDLGKLLKKHRLDPKTFASCSV